MPGEESPSCSQSSPRKEEAGGKNARKNIRTRSNKVHICLCILMAQHFCKPVILPKQGSVVLRSQIAGNWVPVVVPFTKSHIVRYNHNHPQTIWPTWSCCYTIAHCAGYDSDFMFMLWEYHLHLICSKWHLNNSFLFGLISLEFQTTLTFPTLPAPSQLPLITKHSKVNISRC